MGEFFKHYWFLIMMLFIASVIVYLWLYVFNKDCLKAKWWEILIVTLVHTIYGVLTVKFFALLEVGFNVSKAGSMSLYGGIFFMPLMYFIYALTKKLPISLIFDTFVIPLAVTLAFARVNCLYSGCCLGKYINGVDGMRWPARGLDLFVHLGFLGFIIPWVWNDKSKGRAYPLYMIVYGTGRFIIEWIREANTTSPFHVGHIWSLVSIFIGALFLLVPYILKTRRAGAIYKS